MDMKNREKRFRSFAILSILALKTGATKKLDDGLEQQPEASAPGHGFRTGNVSDNDRLTRRLRSGLLLYPKHRDFFMGTSENPQISPQATA